MGEQHIVSWEFNIIHVTLTIIKYIMYTSIYKSRSRLISRGLK